ncbi:MFS transporter [Candidatus Omnitrophota bacterium]
MVKFKEILSNRNFFFLWLGQIVSQFGDRLNQMALIALISARFPGSTFQLAKVLSFTILPVLFVGPLAASYVDRWDRRKTMIFCDFLRAVLVGSVALIFVKSDNLIPVYAIIFLIFSAGRFFVPAKMSIIPELVSKEKLLLANSLSSITGMIAVVAGFGLGGIIVERIGPEGGFLIDALTYVVSGIFIFMIVASATAYSRGSATGSAAFNMQRLLKKTVLADIKEGWQYFAQDRDIRFVAGMVFLLGAGVGAVSVVIVVFIQDTFGSITQDLGVFSMFLGVGLFCGSLIYGRFGQGLSKMRVIFISLGATGMILGVFTLFLRILAPASFTYALSLLLGLSISPIIISAQTLVHQITDQKMRGRIFGSLDIVAYTAFFLFMLLSSFLAERVERFWILLLVSIIFTIVGFGAIILRLDKKRLADV